MKRRYFIVLLALALVLVGCGDGTIQPGSVEPTIDDPQLREAEPSQKELNELLKQTAIVAEFIEINGDRVAEGTRLFATGEVGAIRDPELFGQFLLGQKEGDGYGVYYVKILDMHAPAIEEGKIVSVWGTYSGKDEGTSIPIITATIIEAE